jgi:flagellar hook protein FlgE
MLGSLNSGVSGLRQFQSEMDIIGNNIANSNTIGYKSARADFSDALSQTLQAPSTATGTPGVQVGSGVSLAAVKTLFDQGTTSRTGVQTDLAISGDGFFMVKDTIDSQEFATRAGDFRVDASGYLVTNSGLRVQGFNDSGLSTTGDLQIDGTGRPATSDPDATVTGFTISQTGQITVQLSDNTEFVRGQVLLQNFQNPQALTKQGNSLYGGIAGAGPLGGTTPQPAAPGTNGLGQIQSGTLELSNVDLTNEFANLITTQRGFQASARVITTSDELLQELVNLKR